MTRPAARHEVAVGVLLLVALVLLAWMAIQAGGLRVESGDIRLEARFDDVAGLDRGAVVSVAGVDVGRVTDIQVEGADARVTLAVRGDLALDRDTAAHVRARSLLGEKYVDLVPSGGGGPTLGDGDVIARTSSQLAVEEAVGSLGPLLDQVDVVALAQALNALSSAVNSDPELLPQALADLGAAASDLRQASQDAPALVQEVRAAVSEVRTLGREARPVLQRADRLLAEAEGLVDPVQAAADDLPALVSEGQAAVDELREILARVEGSSEDLATVLENLSEVDLLAIRRLLREDGVRVRLFGGQVEPPEAER